MDYTTLGRTGLKVSVAGFGCGGNSKAGLGTGAGDKGAVAILREAMDLGINMFDTARSYGTEGVLGEAIADVPRDSVVISTKHLAGGTPESTVAALEKSLRELGTDYVDIFMLHGVSPRQYDHALAELAPALLREKERGKLRFLGITETSPNDHEQEMLSRAVHDGCWDVMMLGFNLMHQVARERVFPHTLANGIGTLMMFTVRNVFSVPGRLEETMRELAAEGKVPAALATDDPLGFLVHDGGATSVIDAAYRYARHEPGANVVLFGTGNPDHLRSNVASILSPPLPDADRAKLAELFGRLRGVGLDVPGPR
ncbi:MAG: aldo/keto reductase, partial [Alphaproteobacteria bacterium]|jgi:L-galactose dehydrogenase